MPSRSLVIVVTFIGRRPFWLPAFLVSCGANPDVTWRIYSDVDFGPDVPSNVTIRPTTLAELNERCADTLQARVAVSGRKLNDLKPFYGSMFQEDLAGFGFWAYSDLDIVWGSIRRFLTDELLARYDLVSSRTERLSGHFTLFRNNPSMNRLYEEIPEVRSAMAVPQYAHLDERCLTAAVKDVRRRRDVAVTPEVYWNRELTVNADYQRQMLQTSDASLWWREGRTFGVHGEELMYVHFHKLKASMSGINFAAADSPRAFRISRSGFTA